MLLPIEIVVGGGGPYDPAAGTTDCLIPSIRGMVIWIEKTGYGTYDYSKYSLLSDGGFRLTDTTFSINERWVVHPTGMAYGTEATSYTNGFNQAQVMSSLFGRLGWHQPVQAGSPVINSTNLLSKSGRKFNDGSFHAYVTVKNIKSVIEDAKASDTDLNSMLESIQRAAILRSLTSVFNRNEFISQSLLFNPWNANREKVESTTDFVGIEIYIPAVPDKAVQIDNVSIYLDSDKTFNLYLYNSNRKTPLWTGSVTVQANQQTLVNLSDIILTHMGGSLHGGTYYFGYYQSDLGSARAYNMTNKTQQHNQFFRWRFMESVKTTGEYDFDREEISYSNTNYGLNVHLSAFVDHSWQIVRKAQLFDNVIGMQVAAQVLEMIIYSSSASNGVERRLKETLPAALLMQDVTGISQISNVPKIQGLRESIELEYQRLRDAFYGKPEAISLPVC